MAYERIADKEREKIPDEWRCDVSYNGFHAWDMTNSSSVDSIYVVCLKCLEKRKLQFDKVKKFS